ncbi:hypothetical protein STCU_12045 [Strigomonas culicis]|uniref:Arrestin-like N-terminal domain-containing protein n=1 Tax=Strigomonas culicis TaxID=28005 RepID=S9TBL3_9TRYP|nr:hypothetical protein STCU_12045 [Strigomonas culicis]|eukprot:EPY15412.1 hypothetical protein STCU_12045 [Strigomonas culicis]
MVFLLTRDRVQITLKLPKFSYIPGETVSGTLVLEVLAKLPITAVRIQLEAKEKVSVKEGRHQYKDEFVHFQKLITCFGHSKVSGRKSGAELDVGTYTYPFSITLPTSVPPCYHCTVNGSRGDLVYALVSTIVIPSSLDAQRKWCIVVRATAPEQQVLDRLQTAARLTNKYLTVVKAAGPTAAASAARTRAPPSSR